ncbi:hypothetical protein [Mycobacterium sp.]|uniref:hypothetical protein n=1 Tax=Mycobacterium sp. TaxID=1785 RepID=UPI0012013087|nr:hypothetical protein [Mycobacterium sp.]TAM64730.1 MAG: hypothetical protein EPN51_23080 [Mycobacterium sp.]
MMKAVMVPAVLAAGIACAPVGQADPGQAGLSQPFSQAGGPFVGDWGAHKERVVVNSDGSGTETYSGGTMMFKLSSVQQPQTAYGSVISGGNGPAGSFVTIQLVDGGNGMLFSAGGGDTNFPFCKYVGGSPVNRADCGA